MQYPGANLGINDSTFDLKQAPYNSRLGFIRKVYGILSAQLLFTIFFCVYVMSSKIRTEFVRENLALFFIAVFWVIYFIITFLHYKETRKVPENYIRLFAFTFSESYMIVTACCLYDTYTVITAAVMTLGVTLVLTAYACLCNKKFRLRIGIALIALSSIIMMLFFSYYHIGGIFEVVCCSLWATIYGVYILIDTYLIIDGEKYGITTDDYVTGVVLIYVDIIDLYFRILDRTGKT